MQTNGPHPLIKAQEEYHRLLREEQNRVSRLVAHGIEDACRRGALPTGYAAKLSRGGVHYGKPSVKNWFDPTVSSDLRTWAWLDLVDDHGVEVGILSFQAPHLDRNSGNLHHVIGQLALIGAEEGDGTSGCTPLAQTLPLDTEAEEAVIQSVVSWLAERTAKGQAATSPAHVGA